jgi:toxin FitB
VKYLVDANVLSEPTRPKPNPSVIAGFGILILPKGKKRTALERWFAAGIDDLDCLPWEADTGLQWAELLARLRSIGKAMPIKDSLIAATAILHGLVVATRNRADFANAGVRIVDPFAD